LHANHTITVEDNGRGIPIDFHEKEKMSALEVVLTKMHAGGKFDNEMYKTSSGLHGIGVSATNALSEKLIATVYRDNKIYRQEFSKGAKSTDLKIVGKSKKTGTSIYFEPDLSIFTTNNFKPKMLTDRFRELSFLNSGLKIKFINEISESEEIFYNENGLIDFINHLNKGKEILHDPILIQKKIKDFDFEIIFQYNSGYSDLLYSFANNINTVEGGTHLNGAKAALLKYFREYIDKNKLLKGTSLDVLPKDVLEGVIVIVNIKLSNPEFESQTKIKLNNVEIRQPIEDEILKELNKIKLPEVVFEKVVNSIKVRDATRKARQLVRRKGLLDTSLPGKLADCSETDPEKCEISLCEGNSAAGSLKQARNRRTQAVLALRGKILNVEKNSLNRMLENQEIKDIISSLGIILHKDSIDISKLRYHKIIIMTDADVDGGHICALLLTLFYKYMKQLIELGYLYIGVPPLYMLKSGNQEHYFINDEELTVFLNDFKGNYIIQRFKGLGEMSVDQLEKTTLNESRTLIQVKIEDLEGTNKLFDTLMGDAIEDRKKFIVDNSVGFELIN